MTYPLGIFSDAGLVSVIGREKYAGAYRLVYGNSQGDDFKMHGRGPSIVLPLGRNEKLQDISDVRISNIMDTKVMTYTYNGSHSPELRIAVHSETEGIEIWDVPSLNKHLTGNGSVVGEYKHDGQYVLYFGETDLKVAYSRNLVAWHTSGRSALGPRRGAFDSHGVKLVSATSLEHGILVLYEAHQTARGETGISIGCAVYSKTEPDKLLWRSETPLYTRASKAASGERVLGASVDGPEISLYFSSLTEKIIKIRVPNPYAIQGAKRRSTHLSRAASNPILSPTQHSWESEAVFNPAAFTDNGRVHLLYRAMGPDGISRIGYASSADGIHFDERLIYPVYTPSHGFGAPTDKSKTRKQAYDPILNPSGGGWGGCEDPRVVVLEDQAYMSFVAFDGWSFIRMAMTSITLASLREKSWKWEKPALISAPGETQKNWVLFPEKINGKYAVLHGISPGVHIEYLDRIDDFGSGKYIKSLPPHGGHGYHDASRQHHWDNKVRGAGAPPLKTPMGWLLLYHAIDKSDPGKYKIGAMLLDLQDPTKLLFRSNEPILAPVEWYENEGKPGVVYTCGAVIVGDSLIVYYGGGDKHIAAARANVHEFLNALSSSAVPTLETFDVDMYDMQLSN